MNWFCRLMTVDNAVSTTARLGRRLTGAVRDLGIHLWKAALPKQVAMPVEETSFETLVNVEDDIAVEFHVREACIDRIGVNWHSNDFFQATKARFRLQVSCRFAPIATSDKAVATLLHFVKWLRPYWGELNDEDITGTPTFCGLDGNVSVVPHLGTFNFFDTQYVSFLGGVERLSGRAFTYPKLSTTVCWWASQTLATIQLFVHCVNRLKPNSAPCFERNMQHTLPHFDNRYTPPRIS